MPDSIQLSTGRVIWKETLYFDPATCRAEAQIPVNARILDGQLQNGQYVIWFLCHASSPKLPRTFALVPTGEEAQYDWRYVSTFQIVNESLVFHVFEVRQ